MDVKNLMLGDWVMNACGTPRKVYELVQDQVTYELEGGGLNTTHCNQLYPIPLTEEILVKNGFVKTWNGDWQLKEYATIIISKDYYVKIFERSIRIDYVHELQHLLHVACVDKELVID